MNNINGRAVSTQVVNFTGSAAGKKIVLTDINVKYPTKKLIMPDENDEPKDLIYSTDLVSGTAKGIYNTSGSLGVQYLYNTFVLLGLPDTAGTGSFKVTSVSHNEVKGDFKTIDLEFDQVFVNVL